MLSWILQKNERWISALEDYYIKVSTKESTFLQKEDRLSFCINLEVVNLEVEIKRLFFGRSYDSTILFRD